MLLELLVVELLVLFLGLLFFYGTVTITLKVSEVVSELIDYAVKVTMTGYDPKLL